VSLPFRVFGEINPMFVLIFVPELCHSDFLNCNQQLTILAVNIVF